MNATETADAPFPSADEAMVMMKAAIGQIDFARQYTIELLDATPKDLWYTVPEGLPTHLAWQVGHMTVSQYGLLMFRIRGRRPEDLDLIPGKFRKAYGRGSKPNLDPTGQSTPEELVERLNRVYQLAKAELAEIDSETLLESVDMPFAAYPTKLGAILFCPLHEHIHAGQIGVLRRALGLEPIR